MVSKGYVAVDQHSEQAIEEYDGKYYVRLHGRKGFEFMGENYYVPYYTLNLRPALFREKYALDEDGNIFPSYREATPDEVASGLDTAISTTPSIRANRFTWLE